MVQAEREPGRADATRKKILDAVLVLIARGGPGAITYRAVSAESGCPLGVLTYHFPKRSDLIRAAYESHLERARDDAQALYEGLVAGRGSSTPIDRSAVARAAAGFALGRDEHERARLIADIELGLETSRDPQLERDLSATRAETFRVAEELMKRSGSQSPNEDTWILIAAIEGLTLESLARPSDETFNERVPQLLEHLLDRLFGDP